jgi:UDP-glucose 4-epimerase
MSAIVRAGECVALRVAVTGSSGLVGAAVVRELQARGLAVRGADRVPGLCTAIVGDLREPSVRRDVVDGVDVVVHAAALHAPHVGKLSDADFWTVNVGATAALLDDAERAGMQRVVHISSTSVYGYALVPKDQAVWVDESLRPEPRDIYDETKLAAERLVAGSRLNSISLRIARCFPEPFPVRAVHLLHRAVALADVATAVRLAVSRPAAAGVVNVAGPYPFRKTDCPALFAGAPAVIAERAPEIAAAFRRRGWPLPSSLDRVYDSTAARRALGYRPRYGVVKELQA